jgi:hypothetical protein
MARAGRFQKTGGQMKLHIVPIQACDPIVLPALAPWLRAPMLPLTHNPQALSDMEVPCGLH